MKSYKILHLSDLHYDPKSFDSNIVVDAFFEDIKKQKNIDIVLFSGDLVSKGKPQLFKNAKLHFIDKCVKNLGISKNMFLIAIGNHDINRHYIKNVDHERKELDLKSKTKINMFIDNYCNSDRLNRINNFNKFVDTLSNKYEIEKHRLYRNYILKKDNKTIGISILNSAWASYGGPDDYGRIILGERQVDMAFKKVQNCDFKIAVFHHPERWLNQVDHSFRILKEKYDLLLYGHNHQAVPEAQFSLGSNCIIGNSGCLYESRKNHNSYSIINYNFDKQSTTFKYRSYFDDIRCFGRGEDIVPTGTVSFYKSNESINIRGIVSKNMRVVNSINDYLKMTNNMIESSKKEFLFTSTKMADTFDPVYGDIQEIIIQSSIKFKKRYPDRRHYGIIDATSQTISGSFQLRSFINDLILRFYPGLSSIGFNFMISDKKKVILRLHDPKTSDRIAVSIENEYFASLLRKHFFTLWNKSQNQDTFSHEVLNSNHHIKSSIIKKHFKNQYKLFSQLYQMIKSYDELYSDLDYNSLLKLYENKNLGFKVEEYDHIIFSNFIDIINSQIIKNKNLNIDIHQVINSIKNREQIDYDKMGYAFNYLFFLANYFKAKHTYVDILNLLKKLSINRILDLGGGGGSSINATIDVLNKLDLKDKIKIDVIDNSEYQLNFAKAVTYIDSGKYDIEYIQTDIKNYSNESRQKYDIIIASNIFCELLNASNFDKILSTIHKHINNNGILIVIERTESNIYPLLLKSNKFKLTKFKFRNERYEIPISDIYSLNDLISFNYRHSSKKIKLFYTLKYGIYEKD